MSPNPLVGAVIVDPESGAVLGEGYHAEYGGLHAERAALEDCRDRGNDPSGAEMFVSLEPCDHHGRQPPCSEALITAGISRVVIGSPDPTSKASGRGPRKLRANGIEVLETSIDGAGGEIRRAAESQNQGFRKRSSAGLPWVLLKVASTLDGNVALPDGTSKWITCAESRKLGRSWRGDLDAIAIGSGTATADDPVLTYRNEDGSPAIDKSQPLRVVFDSMCRLSSDSRLVQTVAEAPLLVIASDCSSKTDRARLEDSGARVEVIASRESRNGPQVSIDGALSRLSELGVNTLMVEGGPTLAGTFIESGHVDEWRQFVAPKLFGEAQRALKLAPPSAIGEAFELPDPSIERSGVDFLVRSTIRFW